MQAGEVYMTIGLDRQGSVVEVRVNGKTIQPKEGEQGSARLGGTAPGCEQVLRVLVHELLTCGKKDQPSDTPPQGSDPCCYRDPRTGRVWCWC